MTLKRNFAVSVLDSEYITPINDAIGENCKIIMETSSHLYFDPQSVTSSDIAQYITFFQIESEEETGLNKKLDDLVENLNLLDVEYALRDEDTGEMIVSVKFAGVLDIMFDNIEIIRKGTYEKIDELKCFETELGICNGYTPKFRPDESQPVGDVKVKAERIYLICHSKEKLLKLKDQLSQKIMEIDSDFEIDFKIFTEVA